MNRELENYYLKQPEPIQGCLLALKSIILPVDKRITHRLIEPKEGTRRKNKYEMIEVDPKRDIPVGDITEKLCRQMKLYDDFRNNGKV